MTDIFTKKKRSEIMASIRPENTRIEKIVFRELRKRGLYFQRHYKKVSGKPDIALPRSKKAVFIDGDFWHGYGFSKTKHRLPAGFWVEKIEKNIARDTKNRRKIKKDGWRVLRVWEHEIESDFNNTVNKIESFLSR